MRAPGAGVVLLVGAAVAALMTGVVGAATASHAGANAEPPPLAGLPPDVGVVDSFAFDPSNPEIVYVMARGFGEDHPLGAGVFKTTDGGAHWQAATATSRWPGGHALTADPRHPGTLYAGAEFAVYKTVDGGRSWRPSHRGLYTPPPGDREKGWVIALAVDPANTNIIYAGSDRVSKSTDGGHSWKTVFPPHPTPNGHDVSALAIAPTRPETIYAIIGDFGPSSSTPENGRFSIYKSTDAGTTWQATAALRGSVALTTLAVDPRHPATVYAAIGANLLKTTNAGETWQPIAKGLPIGKPHGNCNCVAPVGGVRALAVDPRHSGTVFAALTQGGIYKTTNGGETWIQAIDPLLYLPTVAVDPARPTTIYVAGASETGSEPHQILRSTDGGYTWATAP